MNIKQLWQYATHTCWPRPGDFTAGEYDSQLEAFAKAIIDECVGKLLEARVADPYTGQLINCEKNLVIEEQVEVLVSMFEDI